MVRRLSLVGLVLSMALLLALPATAAITTELVASGLNRPIFLTAPAGDANRLFVVEQRGVIKIIKNGTVLAQPFLDIDAKIPNISGNDERGLLGLAFHPQYTQNGTFYVNYINLANDTVIARYQVSGDPDVADSASEQILLTVDQFATNHNGGTIAFGPLDGYLYLGMGDGGGSGDPTNAGQRDNTLLGKMLRIDVDCPTPPCIPPDNPHVGPGDPLDEIWAKGVRNPYRWSFDRLTGDLYIADVGQNQWEEVDFQPASSTGGENYGWRIMEGEHCFDNSVPPGCFDPSLILPIHEYSHGGTPFRCSITGGYVYRGSIPEIQGHYFFADFCSDQIWSFRYDPQSGTVNDFTDRTAELDPPAGTIADISGFGEDGLGELYIVDRDGTASGEIYRIVAEPTGVGNDPAPAVPFAVGPAQPNPFQPLLGSVTFDVTVDASGVLDVAIYSSDGRKVRSLAEGTVDAGTRVFRWDGRDDQGEDQPSGIYFVRAEMDGRRLSGRIVLVR